MNGKSLMPCPPLFQGEAAEALEVFKQLRIVDAPGSPTIGEACDQWVFDFAAGIFGAYDSELGKRLIQEFFLLICKKNSKALDLNTVIPTPSGWTTMSELKAGDKVFGVDGRPCNVVATSEVFTDHKCYRLEFSNGQKVIADAGHLWKTKCLKDLSEKARTTQEIADTLFRNDGARNHSMVMPSPIECDDLELPVPPYSLGAWLGDGHTDSARITTMDQGILDKVGQDGFTVEYRHNNGSRASSYLIGGTDRSICRRGHSYAEHGSLDRAGYYRCRKCERQLGKVARGSGSIDPVICRSFTDRLRSADLIGNKHIPEAYFRASVAQRTALLQGLMDTDGHINKNGRVISFTSAKDRLAHDFHKLVCTFGLKSSLIKRDNTYQGGGESSAWHVQFSCFKEDVQPFALERKASRVRSSDDADRLARCRSVHIISAEEVEPVAVKCISVDSVDRQFLFGETMLPTHNSTIAAGIMMTLLIRNWRQSAELIILAPTIEVAQNAYAPARDMVKYDEDLDALFQVQDHLRTITHRGTGATLKVVAADSNTVGGKKASFILVDEIHLFGKVSQAENMLREATGGLASRPEGCVIYLTTQSDHPPAGVFLQKLQYARQVRDGTIVDKRFMPVLYEFPQKMIDSGQHLLPINFRLVNPNLGLSISQEYLERELAKAQDAGEESLRGFLSKFLNVQIGLSLLSNRWPGAEFWERQARAGISLSSILDRSEVITVGIDGGGLDDLLGMAVVGRCSETRDWLVWCRAWAHPSVLERRKSEAPKLHDFSKQGDLSLVAHIGEDIDEVAAIVKEIDDSGLLDRVGVDPAGIGSILDAIVASGVEEEKVIGVSQGWRLGGAIKTAERKLAEGGMVHAVQPMMDWCCGNARVEPRGNSILITKQASGTAKIDPLIALFCAVSLMALNPESRADINDFLRSPIIV